jgi:hypothetical protein
MKKDDFITKEYFEKTLDKRLEVHAQIIIAAVDGVLDRRLKKTEEMMEKKIDELRVLIDGYVKAQEEFK